MLRGTKIVATLGPATDRDNNLEKIIIAGANVVRYFVELKYLY